MKNTHTLFLIVVISLLSASLFALQVNVSGEVKAYENLEVTLSSAEADGTVQEARFFFYQSGEREPRYSEFVEDKGVWRTTVPYTYLTGDELVYYTIMQNSDGRFIRDPKIGEHKARLLQDKEPPTLELISPGTFELVEGKEQLVVFGVADESALTRFNITRDGQTLTRSGVFGGYLSFLITPEESDDAVITIEMEDRYGNISTEEYTFTITAEKAPTFAFDGSYRANLEVEYILGFGESENQTDLQEVFSDVSQNLNISYELGGDGYMKAGPLVMEGTAVFKDTVAATEITEAYPNTLIADLQNFLNLYNPINFANEFEWTGEDARQFENDNQFTLKISLFGPALTYQFGDQKVNFQKETINDLSLRGTAVGIDLPFFELKVAKGLSDLGLAETAWPQNFFGFKMAGKAREAFYLQTNISFISSLQGRYENLKSGADSPIGDLYDLDDIRPEQNMVIGLSSGSKNKLFNLDASFSLSLYNDDASDVLDVDQLATDLEDQGGPDVSSYLGYLDKVQSIFPVLDYFLPTNGLISGVINRTLWGVSYGAEVEVPSLGIQTWIRKTDSTYKSLGASVATDEFSYGLAFEKGIKDFTFSAGYERNKDNIADILFNDIIALVKPDLAPDTTPTSANDISNIVHQVQAGVDFPQLAHFGTIALDYTFLYETTNAEALAAKATDASVATAISTATTNDITSTHTGELRWKSARYKFGDVSTNFGAKTKDSYITNIQSDGVKDGSTFWEFSYALSAATSFSRYAISLGFDHAWSTETGGLTTFGYDTKFSIKQAFFDTITFTASLDQAFKSSLEAFKITGSAGIDKRFGPISTSALFEVSYYDSIVDNSDDALTSRLTIKGVFSK
nr:hypothetical protein [uncultured Sphaerochaeta sp.]